MATVSNTTNFDLELDQILEEAYARVGGEHVTGYDAKQARRSLNLLLIDLINRGLPLSTLDEFNTTVTSSVGEYTCSSNIVDVLHTVYARSSVEIRLERISLFQFKDIPRKDVYGRPVQYTVERNRDNAVIKLWPIPDNSTDIIKFWGINKIDDMTKQDQLVDLPVRYLPTVISGLAYYLSLKVKSEDQNLIQRLKMEYEENLERVFNEDNERSSFFTAPYLRFN